MVFLGIVWTSIIEKFTATVHWKKRHVQVRSWPLSRPQTVSIGLSIVSLTSVSSLIRAWNLRCTFTNTEILFYRSDDLSKVMW